MTQLEIGRVRGAIPSCRARVMQHRSTLVHLLVIQDDQWLQRGPPQSRTHLSSPILKGLCS